MPGYPMGQALTWVLAWAMSGLGPQPRPLRPIGDGGFYFTVFYLDDLYWLYEV